MNPPFNPKRRALTFQGVCRIRISADAADLERTSESPLMCTDQPCAEVTPLQTVANSLQTVNPHKQFQSVVLYNLPRLPRTGFYLLLLRSNRKVFRKSL